MKRLLAILLAVVLIFGLVACAAPSPTPAPPAPPPATGTDPTPEPTDGPPEPPPGSPRIVRLGHVSPTHSARHLATVAMAEYVMNALPGWYDIEVFSAGMLGTSLEMIQGLQTGAMEMTTQGAGMFGGFEAAVGAVEVPGLWPGERAQVRQLIQEAFIPYMADVMAPVGMKVFDYWFEEFVTLGTTVPIRELADFDGVRIRTMASPTQLAIAERLGFTALPMDAGEIYQGILTGVVDGTHNGHTMIFANMIHEVINYITNSNHVLAGVYTVVSLEWWESMSPMEHEVWFSAREVARAVFEEAILLEIGDALVAFAEHNVEVIDLDPAERALWMETLAPVADLYIDMNPALHQAIIDHIRAESARLFG